ncbi:MULTISPECIES: beta-ketoacyl synthase [unclassified Lentimicrobium]|uniref:beta-ketoacyl-[acyl-carrier-protein] synthase family protein n=1 Tax=unclassified Lentimicrobium TaxID=2677434 RepID=UPI0015554869|nr:MULTISPECIES: beta-ketoacyl-[acyl-carrier-protein] synthase family protein [unclassified Lentimicrobium]NPD45292.1 beta-ketoacyl-[acyl-carrier-protein] synthase family protein [Lentimicrobium sp. S6]NPD84408.1 beta-ketoacyl-[acyl-carrier-protein] synthase family protein [Lentimicrobium sp. L6]
MAERIAITGIGIISSLGLNVEENLDSLLHQKSGIKRMELLESIHKEFPVAEVNKTDEELAEILGIKYSREFTRTTLLALIAAQEAWKDSSKENSKRAGVISATTVAGMRTSEKYYADFQNGGGESFFIDTHDAGDSTERIADFLGIKDFMTTISTACSSSANSMMLGSRMLRSGKLDKVLVGGVDALSLFTLNGFNSLMILDKEHCRSFDQTRAGLNLGEGAAYLVLERESDLSPESKVYAYVEGYANANDAFHQTASSPEGNGAAMAMSNALKMANLKPEQIDYINAHGTATNNNDLSEGLAIMKVFGEHIPPVSSTKPYTGHTLAAAGSVEAVFVILALQNQIIFPNLNFSNQMEELSFSPQTELVKKPLNYVLSNSFGFGGNNSSIILSRK